MVKVIIESSSNYELPRYAHEGDSGMDVRANISESIILEPLERAIIPTGIKTVIPEGYEIQVRSRSGLAAKRGLAVLNSPGTIDSNYRGEIGVILVNLSNIIQIIDPGERVAQLVLAKVEKAELEQVESILQTTDRKDGAYGSTGRF